MKLVKQFDLQQYDAVAPYAGAWIETEGLVLDKITQLSPPTRGRGLKHRIGRLEQTDSSRPLRGGVD